MIFIQFPHVHGRVITTGAISHLFFQAYDKQRDGSEGQRLRYELGHICQHCKCDFIYHHTVPAPIFEIFKEMMIFTKPVCFLGRECRLCPCFLRCVLVHISLLLFNKRIPFCMAYFLMFSIDFLCF